MQSRYFERQCHIAYFERLRGGVSFERLFHEFELFRRSETSLKTPSFSEKSIGIYAKIQSSSAKQSDKRYRVETDELQKVEELVL